MVGTFITFEGGEGTGKSTQVNRLATRLRDLGRTILVTREPGGTPSSEHLRNILVSGDVERWSPTAEALLNYAARDSHLVQVIRPALGRNQIVLCDRFMDSTRAYQGFAGGCSMDLIDTMEKVVVGSTRPDLTLIFDLDPDIGLVRAKGREEGEDRYERKGIAFHRQLRAGFLEILQSNPERCRLVDASQSVEQVAETVWTHVCERLNG